MNIRISEKKTACRSDSIILIGMPGSGKSTVGVLLAKTLGYQFCDTDLLIGQRLNKLLYQIIEEEGLDAFIRLEEETVLSMDAPRRTVIATGGSVVFGHAAMERLRGLGTVVYLRLPCDEIVRRVKNIKTRGIVMRPGESMEEIYAERTPLYERYADLTADCQGLTLEETVETIAKLFQE